MLKTLSKQIKQYKLPSLLTPLCMIGEVICEMVIPVLMGYIVDKGIYAGDMNYIINTGIKMLVVAICGLLCGVGGGVFGAKASAGFAHNLRQAMNDSIQKYSFSNIDKFSPSSLVTRMTTDVTNMQNAYQMILRMAIRAPMTMIIAMAMSFMLSARIASIYLAAVIVLGIVLYFMMSSANRYFKKVFEKYDDLNESIQENVTAIRAVKAFVREDYEISRFQKASNNIYLMFVKAELKLAGNSPVMQGTVYTVILIISWVGAHMVVSSTLTTGALMSLLTYCMNILMSLMMFSMVFIMISMSTASARRIAEVIEEKPDITNPENPVMEIPDGSVKFDHVWFSYNKNSAEPVLKDINLDIHSGESVGIIGATGSSKSSLVNLISRLYDVTQGSIKVGGIDVRDYDIKALRDAVSVVLQKNVLFTGTIYDNLRWGNPNATDEQCKEACRLACADEFIDRMPDGYNTRIDQGGTNVSGGQRQRLCIARALLKNPKVLILDDSTSACDTATEAKIRKSFREDIPEATKLIISQRISSVHDCDRVIVMSEGQINGFDTPDNLLKTNEIYREIYESQTGLGNDEADFDSKD
ncbi:MAG: ABC transporter ATP-binding protein [Oscillospiraceae bacterium]|jgi:ATP-binding cassette subfamily B multidrug efflux pump